MGKLATAAKLLRTPDRFFAVLDEKRRHYLTYFPDPRGWLMFYGPRAHRVTMKHRERLGWDPAIRRPKKYTDKVQWRKLYCPQIETFAVLSDKLGVLDYVRERIGSDHILEPTWVGSQIDEQMVRSLGDGVVLKPTHRSGQVAIIERQDEVDAKVIADHMARSLLWPYSMVGEEPWYGWQEPRIMAQPLIWSPDGSKYIQDVKFHVFAQPEGQPKVVCEVINTTPHWRAIYDERFNRLPFEWSPRDFPPPAHQPPKPERFDEMVADALSLAAGIDYVRVDFLLGADNYYFSEMTFAPVGGRPKMEPSEWDDIVGSWWHLDTGTSAERWLWRARTWWPLWSTEMPVRLLRRLRRQLDDVMLLGLQHRAYLRGYERLEAPRSTVVMVTTGAGTPDSLASTNLLGSIAQGLRRNGVDAMVLTTADHGRGSMLPPLLEGNLCVDGSSMSDSSVRAVLGPADWLFVLTPAFSWAAERRELLQDIHSRIAVLSLERPDVTMAGNPRRCAEYQDWVLREAAAVVVVSAETAEYWTEAGYPASRIISIRTAIDESDWPALAGTTNLCHAAYAGSVRKDDLGDLVAVAESVQRRIPDFRLSLYLACADPEKLEWVSTEIASRSLESCVSVEDPVPHADLVPVLQSVGVLLAPQRDTLKNRGGWSSEVGEYLASGRPVVCSATPGLSGIAIDGETAFVAPMGDVEAFADRVVAALSDPVGAAAIGLAGRARIFEVADSAMVAKRLLSDLDRIVQSDDESGPANDESETAGA